tara:strand:- start:711 stop:1520 length:810 start_codon:yes stop_codon:yes gene_type:complete
MKIIKSINRLNNHVNFKANVGFVPTMGSLHKGHISLIESAKKKCDKVLVSIYVNPSQFNKKKDFNTYPRNISRDIKILKKMSVDYLLIPKTNEIYKKNIKKRFKISNRDKILCAKYRKGHFEGVLAVINQFLKIIQAKYMFLGEKDFQQIFLIKKYITKKFKVKIVNCKTIRYNRYLPYSSRNNLLKKKDLDIAIKISKKLKLFYLSIKKKFKNKEDIKKIKEQILNYNIDLEYLEIRNKFDLSKKFHRFNFKIFISYYMKGIRLIDNF